MHMSPSDVIGRQWVKDKMYVCFNVCSEPNNTNTVKYDWYLICKNGNIHNWAPARSWTPHKIVKNVLFPITGDVDKTYGQNISHCNLGFP